MNAAICRRDVVCSCQMKRRRVGKRRAQDRELALAYLAVASVDEVRLDRVIDEHIKRILDATDGNLSLAADLLGMHRRSLQRYARRRKIRPKRKRRVS
jgi:transcriptional regulator with GAF, ATPase, and Fis domain